MPLQPQDSPPGAFLKALRKEGIDCILIGAIAAIRQGAPLMTVDYDFWVRPPERQYVGILSIIQRQGVTIRPRTLYELNDGKGAETETVLNLTLLLPPLNPEASSPSPKLHPAC